MRFPTSFGTLTCIDCGGVGEKKTRNQTRCPYCASKKKKERAALNNAAVAAAKKARRIKCQKQLSV